MTAVLCFSAGLIGAVVVVLYRRKRAWERHTAQGLALANALREEQDVWAAEALETLAALPPDQIIAQLHLDIALWEGPDHA